MKLASVSATQDSLSDAVTQAAEQLMQELGQQPDLVLAFISAPLAAQINSLPKLLRSKFDAAVLLGGIGAGVVAAGHVFEEGPVLSLTAAVLPDVRLQAMHLEIDNMPPTYAEARSWEAALRVAAKDEPNFLFLAEPFSCSTQLAAGEFLKGLDRAFPGAPKVGGLVSGFESAETPCLLLNDTVHHSGIAMVALCGNVLLDPIVVQGCRPIGEPMFATAVHDNLILELDGRAPREVLAATYNKLSRADKKIFTEALFLGVSIQTGRQEYGTGDFLIRTLLGIDPESSALWLNTSVAANNVVQLHLRDGLVAAAEFERALQAQRQRFAGAQSAGALLFSCLDRSQHLYGHLDHNSNPLRQQLGDIPLSGLFCNGEIGPLKRTTYLHNYASVFAFWRSKD